jgi:hypothetical protein
MTREIGSAASMMAAQGAPSARASILNANYISR